MSNSEYLKGKTPAGDSLVLHGLQGQEELSAPFLFTLRFHSADRKVDFKKLIGKTASVEMILPDKSKRTIHGIVTRFLQAGYDPREAVYVAELRPWLWLLTLHADNRIFQKKSVPEILEEVFSDLGFKDVKKSLKGSYAKREYCVQYQESSFDFVSRLMEDEGIFYFFEHAADKHTLVLADDSDAYKACAGSAEARIGIDDDKNCVRDCTFEEAMAPTGYALTDYNFEIPSTDLFHKTGGGSPALVVYEHPGNYEKKAQGEAMTKLRLEAHEGGQKVLRGNSNCRGFSAGGKFKLKEHGRADFNKEYVFRMVSHTADRSSYGNHFEALPADVVFRPPLRARRPMALGSQSAMVVGKSGEEIWTDKFGRVKVHFPWDRKGKKDENSSCWVRVAQHWAGKQYGQFFLPRIGQEVVISFIDGNPDRPLITGAVYNGEQTVPYELPANQTKSTTKTRTSKGGGGFNEIRFEDKKDKEEVFIHAAKDMNVDVKHDRTTKVGNDDSLHVKKNRTKKVDENEETTIKKNRTVEISEGDESLTVKKGKRTILVDKGDETHTVKGKRTLTVHKDEAHTSKAKFDHTVKGNYTLKIGGDLTILVDGDIKVKSKKSISYEAGTEFKLKAGTDVAMKSGTDFKLEAGTNFAQKAAIGFKLAAVTLEAKASAMGEVSSGGIMSLKGALTKIG